MDSRQKMWARKDKIVRTIYKPRFTDNRPVLLRTGFVPHLQSKVFPMQITQSFRKFREFLQSRKQFSTMDRRKTSLHTRRT